MTELLTSEQNTEASSGAIRVLVVDDHRMLRETLRHSLEQHGFDVVGEAGDGTEALEAARRLRPAVVLMDVTMPGMGGVEATRQLLGVLPSVRVVMLTMHADRRVIAQAIEAGAVGYLLKDCSIDEVADTLRSAVSGPTDISPEVAVEMLEQAGMLSGDDGGLSRREAEVLQLIADGASTPEVAETLFISEKTVKNHLASVYSKLHARDRTQAVLAAVRMGVVNLS